MSDVQPAYTISYESISPVSSDPVSTVSTRVRSKSSTTCKRSRFLSSVSLLLLLLLEHVSISELQVSMDLLTPSYELNEVESLLYLKASLVQAMESHNLTVRKNDMIAAMKDFL